MLVPLPCAALCCAEAQEFKKGFEAAADSNSKLITSTATAGGDGSAEAADALAEELSGKAKVDGAEAAPAADAAAEEKAEA